MHQCRSCGKEIAWVRTESGKMMPVELDVEVIDDKGEKLVVAKPHWAYCKDSDQWRKRDKK